MATTLDLSGITAKAAFANGDLDLITINTNGVTKTLRELQGTLTNTTTITVPSYGTFTKAAVGDSTITFTAAATYPAGKVTLTEKATMAEFAKVDFSAATSAVEVTGTAITATILGGLGADKLTAAKVTTSINGGAGDDTITAGFTGSGLNATVKGGLGADKFIHADAAEVMDVADYNYAEGDKLQLAGNFAAGTALSATGTFIDKAAGKLTASATVADNAYKVKVTDLAAVTREYWTAAATTSVSFDGTGKTDALYIDATKAVNAQVTLGGGSDLLTLANTTQATVTAGKSGAVDTVAAFDQSFTGDVLNLKDATLSDVTFGTTSSKIGTGASETTLNGIGAASNGQILVQENGGTIKKVDYTTAAASQMNMTNSSNADVYLGYASKLVGDVVAINATAVTNYGTFINLLDTDKYKNVNAIVGASAAGTYVGTVDSHDISGARGTLFTLSKASEVWGGSSAADTIALGAANLVKDVVWFGTTDGTDLVNNFEGGFGAKNDVVNLYNVADLTTVSFSQGGTNADVVVTAAAGNKVTLNGAGTGFAANTASLKLKNQAGIVQNVAVGTAGAVAIDGVKADVVVGFADGTDTVEYGTTSAQTADIFVNLYDTAKYKNIANIDLSGSTGSHNLAVGSATLASNITLDGANAEAWGGSNKANLITGTATGADTVWYGANDGADTFNGTGTGTFGANDKVKFYDKSVAELAKAYKYTGTQFMLNANNANTLTLSGMVANTAFTVLDKDNTAAKVVVGAAALTYAADAKVYFGTNAVVNVGTTNDVFLYLGNGKDTTVGDVYFSGVTKLDASGSTGKTVLCGAANTADTLTGGSTSSAMWGGGIANDDMKGSASAVDQFWFGTGDGADTASAGVDKGDTVVLYNINSIADVTMTMNAGAFDITAKDGSTLTVTDTATFTALDGGLTFQFGTGSAAKSYTYNRISKSFVAK